MQAIIIAGNCKQQRPPETSLYAHPYAQGGTELLSLRILKLLVVGDGLPPASMPGNENEAAALVDAYLERANTQARLAAVDD